MSSGHDLLRIPAMDPTNTARVEYILSPGEQTPVQCRFESSIPVGKRDQRAESIPGERHLHPCLPAQH